MQQIVIFEDAVTGRILTVIFLLFAGAFLASLVIRETRLLMRTKRIAVKEPLHDDDMRSKSAVLLCISSFILLLKACLVIGGGWVAFVLLKPGICGFSRTTDELILQQRWPYKEIYLPIESIANVRIQRKGRNPHVGHYVEITTKGSQIFRTLHTTDKWSSDALQKDIPLFLNTMKPDKKSITEQDDHGARLGSH